MFEDESTSQDEDQELEDVFRNELQIYLKEKRNDLREDPFTYWKANSARFPHMAELVRRYHCAPPGSAASERVFNTAKDVFGQEDSALNLLILKACCFSSTTYGRPTASEGPSTRFFTT